MPQVGSAYAHAHARASTYTCAGGQADVYLGRWKGVRVAVKQLRARPTDTMAPSVRREVRARLHMRACTLHIAAHGCTWMHKHASVRTCLHAYAYACASVHTCPMHLHMLPRCECLPACSTPTSCACSGCACGRWCVWCCRWLTARCETRSQPSEMPSRLRPPWRCSAASRAV